jgi:hypothetical protein
MESQSKPTVLPRALCTGMLIASTVAGAWISPRSAEAQDAHYWSNQYGTRSVLLGGTVIGTVSDLSSIFYNPGALALAEDPELILAAKVYQYTNVSISGAGEAGLELTSPKFDAR